MKCKCGREVGFRNSYLDTKGQRRCQKCFDPSKEEFLVEKFKLPMLMDLEMVQGLVSWGYHITGNKFHVSFNGSKGYLSHIEIGCEGRQSDGENIIWMNGLRTQRGQLRSKMVSIYYSEEKGVRVHI